MTVLILTLLGLVVVAVVAVLIVRDQPLLTEDPVEPRALRWPLSDPLAADDLGEVRFTVAVRGYRMDEVDRVLDDVRSALALRDARIAELLTARAADGAASDDVQA